MTRVTETCKTTEDRHNNTFAAHLRRQWPLWAWATLLLLVNMPLIEGGVRTSLLYLPDAVATGQWWRALTYPLVHLSWYHFLLDASGFLLLDTCLEDKRQWAKGLYIIGASAGTLGLTLALDPDISRQGLSGLSGIAHGLMAISALEMIRHKDQRTWGCLSLVAVASKSAYELWSGNILFGFLHLDLCGHPLAASHAGGVIGGLLTFILINSSMCKGSPQPMGAVQRKAILLSVPHWTQALLSALVRMLARFMYRIRYEGLAHIPEKGPAVLVCNHVSYVDWLIIASACKRPIHFVMHADIYRIPLLHWVFRLGRVVPIDSGKDNPALLRQAFREIGAILHAGGLMCIFPEGRLTRTGQINPFQSGIEKIIQRNPVPVIPLALRGLWGSFFSHKDGPAMRHRPQKMGTQIELVAGEAILPHQATPQHLRFAVQHLCADPA